FKRIGFFGPRPELPGRDQITHLQRPASHQPVKEQTADEIETADDDCPEKGLDHPVRIQQTESRNAESLAKKIADDFMQVAITIEHDRVVVPGLARPEPNPARSANERADEDQ